MRSTLVSVLILAGCAGGPKNDGPPIEDWESLYPEVVDPERETEGPRGAYRARWIDDDGPQGKMLDQALGLYIDGKDEELAEVQAEIAEDPLASYWWARQLCVFVVKAREAAEQRTGELSVGDPVWNKPIGLLREMGAAAVPAVVLDLLRHPASEANELGRELLVEIGPPGMPAWIGVFQLDDDRAKRRLLEVMAEFDEHGPEMLAAIQRSTKEEDFGVRAAAYRALGRNADQVPMLLVALREDDDPFVRRAILDALAAHPTREVATSVVGFMADCLESGDRRGLLAADAALQKMSGRRHRATVEAWRAWASSLDS